MFGFIFVKGLILLMISEDIKNKEVSSVDLIEDRFTYETDEF